jgi:hypothetical protein
MFKLKVSPVYNCTPPTFHFYYSRANISAVPVFNLVKQGDLLGDIFYKVDEANRM